MPLRVAQTVRASVYRNRHKNSKGMGGGCTVVKLGMCHRPKLYQLQFFRINSDNGYHDLMGHIHDIHVFYEPTCVKRAFENFMKHQS